jgi:hypothetical protein
MSFVSGHLLQDRADQAAGIGGYLRAMFAPLAAVSRLFQQSGIWRSDSLQSSKIPQGVRVVLA